ncbi:putative myosin heavy chain [Toxoplasma gondii CAST]|uniref:Putative myosin heavy chain n=1 Tax=Toxoplasma gondii CAST TaxID=943122 RepID=A0A425HR21_TOXGO|nr:putative myosin heavy chain [Toxoplasma gondii CAST]
MSDEPESHAVNDVEDEDGEGETDGFGETRGSDAFNGREAKGKGVFGEESSEKESGGFVRNPDLVSDRERRGSAYERDWRESEMSAFLGDVSREGTAVASSRTSSPECEQNSTNARRSSDSYSALGMGADCAKDASGRETAGQDETEENTRNGGCSYEQGENKHTRGDAADEEHAQSAVADRRNRVMTAGTGEERTVAGTPLFSRTDGRPCSQKVNSSSTEEKATRSPDSKAPPESDLSDVLSGGSPLGEDFDASRRAFLTEKRELRVDDLGRPDSRRALFETLKNGPKIRDEVERIHGLLESLDQRVDKLMGDHERDFLLAYRTHMYTIQKQMDYFKEKADEEQTKLLRDVKIRTLEKELNWFMSEALRLDELCKQYQKDLNKWRDRADALSEDRTFLEKQVKSCKRQIRALQARLEELDSKQQEAADGSTGGGQLSGRETFAEVREGRKEAAVLALANDLEQSKVDPAVLSSCHYSFLRIRLV